MNIMQKGWGSSLLASTKFEVMKHTLVSLQVSSPFSTPFPQLPGRPLTSPVPVTKPPSALSSTTLPKQALSYRWVINNAGTFFWNDDREFTLNSPTFYAHLPSSNIKSSWSLLIERKALRYCRPSRMDTTIYLCQGPSIILNESRILISECTFSFLHPNTYEARDSFTAPTKECVLDEQLLNKCIEQPLEWNKFKECLRFSGTLTVQVNANLFCIDNPTETVDRICKVPLDSIRKEMHSLYKDEVFTDVTIKCGEEEFKVHKAVLASQSPVFKAMFQVDMAEKGSGTITITDLSPKVVSDLVAYLYTGTAPNLNALAKELLNTANKYELTRLFAMCENELKMKMEVANVVDTLILADLHGAANLKKACLNFIRLHSAEVHKTRKWKYLKDNLGQYATLVLETLR